VEGTHGGKSLEDHEVEGALENFRFGSGGHVFVGSLLLWDGKRSMS
jgi:hypothetical protein